jgi:hypothetical protein
MEAIWYHQYRVNIIITYRVMLVWTWCYAYQNTYFDEIYTQRMFFNTCYCHDIHIILLLTGRVQFVEYI